MNGRWVHRRRTSISRIVVRAGNSAERGKEGKKGRKSEKISVYK